jgi:histidinol-phosphate phosphatase family protein
MEAGSSTVNSHPERRNHATTQNESPQIHEKKTVFLDRDGVINERPKEHDYVKAWDEFHFLSGAPEALSLFNRAGYRVVIVSNQRGVARGIMTSEQIEALHTEMREALAQQGATVDGIYVCPHEAGTCTCRKPEIGLFLQAEADAPVSKEHSYLIGDSPSDITAGVRYGIKTVLICDGDQVDFGQDFTYATLLDAAKAIINEGTRK